MHNLPSCPVLDLMPEFARVVQLRLDLDDARCAAQGREEARIKREEDRNNDRLDALETLIMATTAESERGKTLQLILAGADVDTLFAWTLDEGEEVDVASRSKKRLHGMLDSLLRGRDLSAIPSAIRSAYLGSAYGDDWIPDTGGAPPTPPITPRRELVAAC